MTKSYRHCKLDCCIDTCMHSVDIQVLPLMYHNTVIDTKWSCNK